jgi:hypothetical protein
MNLQPQPYIITPITEQSAQNLWSFYPEILEMKKNKKKCCKNYKKDKGRCKKCPMTS